MKEHSSARGFWRSKNSETECVGGVPSRSEKRHGGKESENVVRRKGRGVNSEGQPPESKRKSAIRIRQERHKLKVEELNRETNVSAIPGGGKRG